jgi:hypothetical protein
MPERPSAILEMPFPAPDSPWWQNVEQVDPSTYRQRKRNSEYR